MHTRNTITNLLPFRQRQNERSAEKSKARTST